MDLLQTTLLMGYSASGVSFFISIIAWYWVTKLGYKPFGFIGTGLLLVGIGTLLDMRAISLPWDTSKETVLLSLQIDIIITILGMAMVVYGFLNSHKNTRFYAERLIIYNFLFGLTAASYYFFPYFDVEWIAGEGWKYGLESFGLASFELDSIGLLLLDQLLFLPIFELLIHALRRLQVPFRNKKSRSTTFIFLIGILITIGANVVSYYENLWFYIGLGMGFFFMGYAFLKDPLMLTITYVKIYDLVVGVQSVAVARYNFEKEQTIQNEQLFSGAFSGISTLTGEMLSTNKELLMLQTEDKAVLIHKSKYAKIYLVTNKVDEICKVAMQLLGRFVDEYYRKRNLAFNLNIDLDLFEREVLKIFSFA